MEISVCNGRPFARAQNALQKRLRTFVNGGFTSRRRTLAAMAGVEAAWRGEARTVAEEFRRLRSLPGENVLPGERIPLRPYSGSSGIVADLCSFLSSHLGDFISFAVVHGSVATGEEIAYSDLDTLVVLKDDVVGRKDRLAAAGQLLNQARRFMHAFDPLQHHGWFTLTDQDLRCHCDVHFPAAVLRQSALLYPSHAIDVEVQPRDGNEEADRACAQLGVGLKRRIESRRLPENLYELKVFLSQIMLLPSMYVHVRDGNGVWKGYSFELARHDFTPEAWQAIETASDIRQVWPDVSTWTRPSWPDPIGKRLIRRTAPAIPSHIAMQLTERFYASVLRLVHEMHNRANELRFCDRHGEIRNAISC